MSTELAHARIEGVMTSVRVPKRGTTFYDQGVLMCVVDASASRVFYGADSSTVQGSRSCTPAEFRQRFGTWFEDRDYRTITTPHAPSCAEQVGAGGRSEAVATSSPCASPRLVTNACPQHSQETRPQPSRRTGSPHTGKVLTR